MKCEINIDRAIVARYQPKMLEYGNVFKLTKDKGDDWYTLQTYFKTVDGSLIKINHTEARVMGDIKHIKDAQLEFDFLKEAIREIVKEEIIESKKIIKIDGVEV